MLIDWLWVEDFGKEFGKDGVVVFWFNFGSLLRRGLEYGIFLDILL